LSVAIVTDSACGLGAGLAEEQGVTVVPMWLSIGDRQYKDGELSMAQVVGRLGEGLSTSCPAPGDLSSAIDAAADGSGVVVLTVSRRMSGSFDAARLAAGLLEPARVGEVVVVDTGTAAAAQGLVVLEAARAARRGAPLAEVVAVARAASGRARLLATLPSLDHLSRSGRVPEAAAWGARWLGLNPLFEFRAGRAWPLRPARSQAQALRRIAGAWERQAGRRAPLGRLLCLAAFHAAEPALAEELLSAALARHGADTAFVAPFSPTMLAHTGPGLVGLAWL